MKHPRQKRNVEAHIALGVAQRGLRKYKAAEKSFNRAKKMKSSDPRPDYNLGILYHEHLAAQDDVDLEGIKKHYRTAKEYFQKFASKAGNDKQLAAMVADARHRSNQIDESFKTFKELKELEKKAKELEEQQRRQEEQMKKELLDEEKRALERAREAERRAEEAAKKAAEEEKAKKGADKKKPKEDKKK
jgi:hypothetical protein